MKTVKTIKTVILFLTLLVTPSVSIASGAYEIYTYGSGDFVAQTFHAINMLFSAGIISDLIKMFLILVFLHIMLKMFFGSLGTASGGVHDTLRFDPFQGITAGLGAFLRTAIIAIIVVTVLLNIKTNVNIIDRIDPNQTQVVGDVPWINAVVASYSSIIGDKIGGIIEETVSPPDAPKVRNEGFLSGPRYINDIFDLVPPSSPTSYMSSVGGYIPLRATVSTWFERCILPNFAYIPGESSHQAQGLYFMKHGGYLLSPSGIFATSPIYRNPTIDLPIEYSAGQPLSCYNAPEKIISEWSLVFHQWLETESRKLIGETEQTLQFFSISDRIAKIYDRYFESKFTYGFAESMVQIALINELGASIMAFDAKYGDGSLANKLTERKVGGGWIQAAKLFGKIVIYIRQLFEALIYGFSIFLPVAFVVIGYRAIIEFIKINFWLQMWVPGFVLINAFSDWQLNNLINTFNFTDGGFSFATMSELRNQVNLMLGYFGAFMWSIPALAWGIVKGSDYAMTTAMTFIGGSGRTQAESLGGQMRGLGTVSVGTQAYGGTRFIDSTISGSFPIGMQQAMIGGTIASGIKQLGLANFNRAITGNEFKRLADGLTAYQLMQGAMQMTGKSNPIEALRNTRLLGGTLGYDQKSGIYTFHGEKGGPLPISFMYDSKTGDFRITGINDDVFKAKWSSLLSYQNALSYALDNSAFREWAFRLMRQDFEGKSGTLEHSFARQTLNSFLQYWKEGLDRLEGILENSGFTRRRDSTISESGGFTLSPETITQLAGRGISAKDLVKTNYASKQNPNDILYFNVATGDMYAINTQTGSVREARLSSDVSNAIKTTFDDAISRSIKTTYSSESGFRHIGEAAKQAGGRIAEIMKEASTIQRTTSEGLDLDKTHLVFNNLVKQMTGGSPATFEDYVAAAMTFKHLVSEGDVNKLSQIANFNPLNPKDVENAITAGEQSINNQIDLNKGNVESKVKPVTGNPQKFAPPFDPSLLKRPNYDKFREERKKFEDFSKKFQKDLDTIGENSWSYNILDRFGNITGLPITSLFMPETNEAARSVQNSITGNKYKSQNEEKPLLRTLLDNLPSTLSNETGIRDTADNIGDYMQRQK